MGYRIWGRMNNFKFEFIEKKTQEKQEENGKDKYTIIY